MMKFTKNAVDEIKAVLLKPLVGGELRKIEALGNLYVSLQRFPEDDERISLVDDSTTEYWYQYDMKIDGVQYHFYGATPVA